MDSNHRLVIRCAGAHQHFRPRRCLDSNQRLCPSAVHTADTYIDLRSAKYRCDKYVRELRTYTHTFRADARVGGRRHLPHSDVWVLLRIDGCIGSAHRSTYNDYVVPRTT